jgi:anti-anti-sigma regulatory factor
VVLDLSHVTRLDRGGAAALLDACVATALRRGTLSLTGLTSRRHAALERIGVLKVIDVVESAPAWPGHIARKECSS